MDQPTSAPRHGLIGLLSHEAAGGVLLIAIAVAALIISNSPLSPIYDQLLSLPMSIRVGPLALDKPLLLWINDGLMAIFFFLVGLEIKKEVLKGELSSVDKALLPAIGAVGGMLVPAAIYAAINWNDPAALRGWAIPSATDIAFAVGVLSLLGSRVPVALKAFLLALAILDDLGAIVIIAIFYTSSLSPLALSLAAIGCAGLVVLNRLGVNRLAPYVLVGLFIWVCVLKSGVHATLAGVAVAAAIPMIPRRSSDSSETMVDHLQHALHPWVAFGVMPVFAFANAGVSLEDLTGSALVDPIAVGIALGLFLGKPIGIVGAVLLGTLSGLTRLPAGTTWRQMIGIGCLGGIGFTMSLFIGTLALPNPDDAAILRLGVLSGSIASALTGYLLLRRSLTE